MSLGAGLDAGRSRARLAEVRVKKGEVSLTRYHSVAGDPGDSARDTAAAAFGRMRRKPAPVRVGVSGADVMMRYLPVPEVEDWRLERLMEFEVREIESRSGSPLATSYNLLPVPKELDEEDTILLALVREDLLDEWIGSLGSLPVQGFSPSSIALYNTFLQLGDHAPSVTLLANVGAGTLDLALVRGSDLYFARSVTSSLEKRDSTLASGLGIDRSRAQMLIHKHLDLGLATGARLSTDADRVTRPLVPLYDPLPTLLSGMVTLCKAQARLRDLALDRVLLTGGGAAARGLPGMLSERLQVPVSVWDPAEMVDASALPEDQYEQLRSDGPASTVALGLALSAADPDLYALEILPKAARKKRDFRERGVYAVAAGLLAVAFLGADFAVNSSRASEAQSRASAMKRQVDSAKKNHSRALDLMAELEEAETVAADLTARFAVRRTAQELTGFLSSELPDNLWIDAMTVSLEAGDDWGAAGRSLAVATVEGRGENRARRADQAFTEFSERLKAQLPGGDESIEISTRPSGREFRWTLRAHLETVPGEEPEEEEE